jgi:hypothetical protein
LDSFSLSKMGIDTDQAMNEAAQYDIYTRVEMTSMLCNSDLGALKLPGFIWLYIFSFITSKEEALFRLNEKEAKEYEKQEIAAFIERFRACGYRKDNIPSYFFQARLNELNALLIIGTHFQYYQYALTVAPYFRYDKICGCKSYENKIKRMSARVFRQIIEELLPLLLDIFIDGDFRDTYPGQKMRNRTRNGLAIKHKITDPTTPYITKLDAIRSLIAIFNSSILRPFKIPGLNQTYTHLYINGSNMVIPIPMTLDVYLGLASQQL